MPPLRGGCPIDGSHKAGHITLSTQYRGALRSEQPKHIRGQRMTAPITVPITVLKFGSSVLSGRDRLSAVVHDIYRAYRRGHRVVVVVSAIGRHTDILLEEAQMVADPAAPEAALAKLLSTGEDQAAALLTMAVHRAGIPCRLLEPQQIGLVLHGARLDADPYSLNRHTLLRFLQGSAVAIMPGFSGVHEHGGVALLGRGGSDLTAAFVAEQLDAKKLRLVKDVDGIYERDPASVSTDDAEQRPQRYAEITYEDTVRVAGVLVQPKAVEYLQCTRRSARVTSLLHDHGTVVGCSRSRTGEFPATPPLRVAMIGLGKLGLAVYRHLEALPEYVTVEGIGVHDPGAHHGESAGPEVALYEDLEALLERDFDVLIELTGNSYLAYGWIEMCLQRGRHVVTADTQLLAHRGAFLCQTASRCGAGLRYSAAVGGSAPMVETVRRAAATGPIRAVRAVLSSTSNYVLDEMLRELSFDEAVAAARASGVASGDPHRAIAGKTARDKLRILAHAAWGSELASQPIAVEGIDTVTREQLLHAQKKHRRIRLVASMTAAGEASVRPEWLLSDDYLANARGSENRLEVMGADGDCWRAEGQGAGAWPAAEAVVADVVDLWQKESGQRARPAQTPTVAAGRLPPLRHAQ